MIRRVGLPPDRTIRYRLRPGAYAILPHGGALLLTRQLDSDEALQLPGGGIDPGESPLTALHREVFEETGWRIAAPRRIGAFRRFVFMPDYGFWAEKLCTVYLARPTSRIGPPSEPHHEALFAGVSTALRDLGNTGDKRMVALAYRRGWIT